MSRSAPRALYAHTCEAIDFEALRGKRVAVLGGGASAFDNAQHALGRGVGQVHVFVRRPELPRVNPIRFMEQAGEAAALDVGGAARRVPRCARLNPLTTLAFLPAGFMKHFSDLPDATKYAGIDFFMKFNQPPTNDTFNRCALGGP